jgi:hypothetical protein
VNVNLSPPAHFAATAPSSVRGETFDPNSRSSGLNAERHRQKNVTAIGVEELWKQMLGSLSSNVDVSASNRPSRFPRAPVASAAIVDQL